LGPVCARVIEVSRTSNVKETKARYAILFISLFSFQYAFPARIIIDKLNKLPR